MLCRGLWDLSTMFEGVLGVMLHGVLGVMLRLVTGGHQENPRVGTARFLRNRCVWTALANT